MVGKDHSPHGEIQKDSSPEIACELWRKAVSKAYKTLIPGAAYIRYSSSMQDDSFSLDAQLRQIKARAERDGVEIVVVFSDAASIWTIPERYFLV